MKNPEQLIADYLDNAMSAADEATLNAWLKADATNMTRFTEVVMFEQQIRTAAQAKAQQRAASGFDQPMTPASQRSRWLSWRPITAAVAGVAVGMLCTTMVFAYAVPMKSHEQVLSFFDDGFENEHQIFRRGFPNSADEWWSDFDALVSAQGGVSPKEGQHMVRLVPKAGRRFCAAARIVDLSEMPFPAGTEASLVEVTASFHGIDTKSLNQNQIRIAAFSQAPQDVRAIWNTDPRLEKSLLSTARTVTMKAGDQGWQTLKLEMEIPAETRSLVIYLGAGMANDQAPKTPHYVDDVHVHRITQETPLP
jgi:hypothetical protein